MLGRNELTLLSSKGSQKEPPTSSKPVAPREVVREGVGRGEKAEATERRVATAKAFIVKLRDRVMRRRGDEERNV